MTTATKKTPPANIPAAQMNAIMRYCALIQDVKIIMHQVITPERIRAVREFTEELERRNQNAISTRNPLPAPAGLYEYDIFLYGYITGIRAERQKKNRRTAK